MTSFAVVEFLSSSSESTDVAIVNVKWIFQKDGVLKTYWPPFWRETKKLETAVKNGDDLKFRSWEPYDIKILKAYATYGAARMKLPSHEKGKDSSSCMEETRGRRAKNLKRRCDPHDGDVSSEEEIADNQDNSRPRNKKGKKHADSPIKPPRFPTPQLTVDYENPEDDFSLGQFNDNNSNHSITATSGKKQTTLLDFTALQPSASRIINANLSTRSDTAGGGSQRRRISDSDDEFNERNYDQFLKKQKLTYRDGAAIMQKLEFLVAAVKEISKSVNMLVTSGSHAHLDNSMIAVSDFNLPLLSILDLNKLEESLVDDRKKSQLAKHLSVAGGTRVSTVTYRIMHLLMKDDLAIHFSFSGKREKNSFANFKRILATVFDAVRSTPLTCCAQNKEIEDSIKYWLKKAPERVAKDKKSSQRKEMSNAVETDA